MAAERITNTEWKATISKEDFYALRVRLEPPLKVFHQTDTYFSRVGDGQRLKMREQHEGEGAKGYQLVHYARTDCAASRKSEVTLLQLGAGEAQALGVMLEKAYGADAIVVKVRMLYMRGPARIHIDAVNDLGYFVEVEVVREGGGAHDGDTRIADELRKELGIGADQIASESYREMMMQHGGGSA